VAFAALERYFRRERPQTVPCLKNVGAGSIFSKKKDLNRLSRSDAVANNSSVNCENQALKNVLNKMKDLPDFDGITLLDAKIKGAYGNTPLHIAAIQGDLSAVQILIDCGAEKDAKGEHGYTPLHEAIEQGNVDAVELLIKNGSSTKIPNNDGLTAIDLANVTANDKIIKLLR
jgi:ankyrin repeat protein